MDCQGDYFEDTIGSSPSMRRTSKTMNLHQLCQHDPTTTRLRGTVARKRTANDSADDNASDSEHSLYMKPKRRRWTNRPLHPRSNSSSHVADDPSDPQIDTHSVAEAEEQSWDIIDHEISAWQYVCCTGRPYWWSPESRDIQGQKFSGRSDMSRPGSFNRPPASIFDSHRRAFSESYLKNPSENHDMAHLIAIQLLGSCFTLSPGAIINTRSSGFKARAGAGRASNPQLISALRMHTQFRYSPCFGHQARNSSPVHMWSLGSDGQCSRSSSPVVYI